MLFVKILSKLVCFSIRKKKKIHYTEYTNFDGYDKFEEKYQKIPFSIRERSRTASVVDIERLQTTSTATTFKADIQYGTRISDKDAQGLLRSRSDRSSERPKYHMGIECNEEKSQGSQLSFIYEDVKMSRKRPTEVDKKIVFQPLLDAKVPLENIPKYSSIEPYGNYLNTQKKGLHSSISDTSFVNDTKHDPYTTDIESSFEDNSNKEKFYLSSKKQDPNFTNSESSFANNGIVLSHTNKNDRDSRRYVNGTKQGGQKELMDDDIENSHRKHTKKMYKKSFEGDKEALFLFHKPLQRYRID